MENNELNEMRLCAVVVTYYPNVEEAKKNIMQYLPWVDKLIIWENTPEDKIQHYKIAIPEYENKISYMGTGNNEGISVALNNVAKWALDNGFPLLLTMDQDSCWNDFYNFKRWVYRNYSSKIGIYAPTIYDIKREIHGLNTPYHAITSGSIYNVAILKKLGYFLKYLFIDCVDTEYCLRIRHNSYSILISKECELKQSLGDIKLIPKIKKYYANYSAFRLYYIVRNNIIIWRLYRGKLLNFRFLYKDLIERYLIREPILIGLAGKNKIAKINAIFRGVIEGIFYKIK